MSSLPPKSDCVMPLTPKLGSSWPGAACAPTAPSTSALATRTKRIRNRIGSGTEVAPEDEVVRRGVGLAGRDDLAVVPRDRAPLVVVAREIGDGSGASTVQHEP